MATPLSVARVGESVGSTAVVAVTATARSPRKSIGGTTWAQRKASIAAPSGPFKGATRPALQRGQQHRAVQHASRDGRPSPIDDLNCVPLALALTHIVAMGGGASRGLFLERKSSRPGARAAIREVRRVKSDFVSRRVYFLCEFHGATARPQVTTSRNMDHAQDVNASDKDSGVIGQPDEGGDALRLEAWCLGQGPAQGFCAHRATCPNAVRLVLMGWPPRGSPAPAGRHPAGASYVVRFSGARMLCHQRRPLSAYFLMIGR